MPEAPIHPPCPNCKHPNPPTLGRIYCTVCGYPEEIDAWLQRLPPGRIQVTA